MDFNQLFVLTTKEKQIKFRKQEENQLDLCYNLQCIWLLYLILEN